MQLLTEQDLAMVHSPEYFSEESNYIYESEEEALYEDYLNEMTSDFEIDALSNFLAENFETEELDYLFAIVEELQYYFAENFEFENENEINEAILLLDEESVEEILEDIEYDEGITDATYEDILESVQSIYDSSEVIEEGILRTVTGTVLGILGKGSKPPKKNKESSILPGQSKITGAAYGTRRSKSKLKIGEEYEYLMEQAAVLSTLKVATMLAEAGFLGNLSKAAEFIATQTKEGGKRHMAAMKKLDAYNKRRRAEREAWKSKKEPSSVLQIPTSNPSTDLGRRTRKAPSGTRSSYNNIPKTTKTVYSAGSGSYLRPKSPEVGSGRRVANVPYIARTAKTEGSFKERVKKAGGRLSKYGNERYATTRKRYR